ncbi:hypothetical protein JTB14_002552 [Gonioctena quinquepunctata]|nr:hypothetical protein JTB14_002552 [Gonioctena quinquepunctata]
MCVLADMAHLKTRLASCEQMWYLFSPGLAFMDLENDDPNVQTTDLVSKYPSDLADSDSLVEEILHIKSVYSTVFQSEKDPMNPHNSMRKTSK